MPSKMITRRQKSARDVSAAINQHAHRAQEAIAAALERYLRDGESVPDLMPLQRLFERILEQHREEIVAADEAHLAELRDDNGPRLRRDAAATTLAARLTVIRDTMRGVLGAEAAQDLLGLGGAMDRDPEVLARKGRRVLALLRSDTFQLPPPRSPGVTVDPRPWAEGLEDPLEELETTLDRVARDRRLAETTFLAKQKAMRQYDQAFLQIARLQESIFRFAGLKDLAARIRPSGRRPGQTISSIRAPDDQAPALAVAESSAQPKAD